MSSVPTMSKVPIRLRQRRSEQGSEGKRFQRPTGDRNNFSIDRDRPSLCPLVSGPRDLYVCHIDNK